MEDGMRFFTWLFGQAPTEADPPPDVVVTITINDRPQRTAFIPDTAALERTDNVERKSPAWPYSRDIQPSWAIPLDRNTEREETAPKLTLGPDSADAADLGDAFCLLEYCDSSGEESSRRVSMRSLKESAGHIYLTAFCFERKALRQFRLDRITAMISEDGEVLDPAAYFALHGVQLRLQTEAEIKAAKDAARTLAAMRPGLVMITAVARADRNVHRAEIDAAQTYAERELVAMNREGMLDVQPSIQLLDAMNREIALMRPLAPTLKAQALCICDWSEARLGRLRRAIVETVVADGRILPSELDMVAELDRLIGESPHARRSEVDLGFDEARAAALLRCDH
jgi:WYL domain